MNGQALPNKTNKQTNKQNFFKECEGNTLKHMSQNIKETSPIKKYVMKPSNNMFKGKKKENRQCEQHEETECSSISFLCLFFFFT